MWQVRKEQLPEHIGSFAKATRREPKLKHFAEKSKFHVVASFVFVSLFWYRWYAWSWSWLPVPVGKKLGFSWLFYQMRPPNHQIEDQQLHSYYII